MMYNDRSPLENMSCAKLFEIVRESGSNIFAEMPRQQFQELRRVCVDAILSTDSAQHFNMIKEVQMFFEVHSEVLQSASALCVESKKDFLSPAVLEVFRQPETRKVLVRVIMHLGDMSNSMKPFRICRIWAWQLLEEFFQQGDAERQLWMPVQALCDRQNVNRAFSQIGFVEFLAAPLTFAVAKVLPPTESLAKQVAQNLKSWHQTWLTETQPPPPDAEKKRVANRITTLLKRYDCES